MTRTNSSKQSARLHVTSPVAMTAAAVVRGRSEMPDTARPALTALWVATGRCYLIWWWASTNLRGADQDRDGVNAA
jgi:RecB family exonuclease